MKLLGDKRIWLAGGVIAIFIATQTFGLSEYLSIATLAENRSLLMGFVDGHMAIAIVAFVAVYTGLVSLSLAAIPMKRYIERRKAARIGSDIAQ